MMQRALFALLLLFSVGLVGAQELQPVPRLSAHVTDPAGILPAERRERMEARLAAFEKEKGAQIAVLLIATVKPETIEQYALRVVEAWKIGRKGVDDGALLLVAKEDRKLRIEVGYGLEGALNDVTAKRIISETIAPRFKEGDYPGGIDAGLDAMLKVIGGETLPPASASEVDPGIDLDDLIPVAFIFVFVVGGILRSIFGRFVGAGIVGAAVGFIASLLVSSWVLAGVIGIAAFLFALLAGMSGGGGWHSGGGSWSSGSSDSFSGGGGSFGGGGASGDW